jgi:hypothetical protein
LLRAGREDDCWAKALLGINRSFERAATGERLAHLGAAWKLTTPLVM